MIGVEARRAALFVLIVLLQAAAWQQGWRCALLVLGGLVLGHAYSRVTARARATAAFRAYAAAARAARSSRDHDA